METKTKITARTKEALKMTFSKPLRAKEVEEIPQALPNPVPFV
jgi:hypothetical protein